MIDRTVVGEAQTRLLRAIAMVYGSATIVFGVLSFPSIAVQLPLMTAWWSWSALLGIFGLPFVMAVTAMWSPAPAIKRWAAAVAIVQLAVLATWIPFMQAPELPANASSPWILGVTAVGTTAAAMAWPGRYLWVYIPATATLVVVDRALTAPLPAPIPWQDGLYTVTFSAVFAALASACLSAGAALDQTAATAKREATAEAAGRAAHRERAWVNALIHDQVLVTLLAASEMHPALQQVAAAQAKTTLARLEQSESSATGSVAMSGRDLAWQLQAAATETDPDAVFTYTVAEDGAHIPADVARALGEGLAEALRNVLRHAHAPGAELHRAVNVQVTRTGAQVDVLDDGRGFDPDLVAPARLGIAVSIRERMALLSGGSAEIVSVPGRGARVILRWTRT